MRRAGCAFRLVKKYKEFLCVEWSVGKFRLTLRACRHTQRRRRKEERRRRERTEMGLDGKAGAPLHQSLPSRLVLVLPFQEDETPSLALAHSPKYMLSGMGWDMTWEREPRIENHCGRATHFIRVCATAEQNFLPGNLIFPWRLALHARVLDRLLHKPIAGSSQTKENLHSAFGNSKVGWPAV